MSKFELKYLKYKSKYLSLKKNKNQLYPKKRMSGGGCEEIKSLVYPESGKVIEIDNVYLIEYDKTCNKFNKFDWVWYSYWEKKTRANPVGVLTKYMAQIEKIELNDEFGFGKIVIITLFIYKDLKTGKRIRENFFKHENHEGNRHAYIKLVNTENTTKQMILDAFKYNNPTHFKNYQKVNTLKDNWTKNGGTDELLNSFVDNLGDMLLELYKKN